MKTALEIVRGFHPSVKSVADAKRGITIHVTKKDNAAKHKNHKECALAVACKRLTKADGVIVAKSVAYVIHKNRATRFTLPEHVTREIISFDRNGGFEPGKYQMQPPDLGHRLGGYPKRPKKKGVSGRKRRKPTFTQNVRFSLGV